MTSASSQMEGYTLSSVIDKYWQKHREGEVSTCDLDVSSKGLPSTTLHSDANAAAEEKAGDSAARAHHSANHTISFNGSAGDENVWSAVNRGPRRNDSMDQDHAGSGRQRGSSMTRDHVTTDHQQMEERVPAQESISSEHMDFRYEGTAYNACHEASGSPFTEAQGSGFERDAPTIKSPSPMLESKNSASSSSQPDQISPHDIAEHTSVGASAHWSGALDESRTRPRHSAKWSSFRPSHDGNTQVPPLEAVRAGNPIVHERAQRRWSILRDRVLPDSTKNIGPNPSLGRSTALASTMIASVPVTTELWAGQLPVMILKTWLDRDEDGRRAVPVLLGNLRFRVGDSVGLQPDNQATGKEMFKIECEYGDGAVKWVIFRELRDFLSLHAHYKAASLGSKVPSFRSARRLDIPDFPKISIPYLNRLGGRDAKDKPKFKDNGRAEYAESSRSALQRYLVDLIRAVIFRPESNRLCKFFELSALTLALAPTGGFQGKAGFLKMPGSNASRRANQPGLTPASWIANRAPKWFIVRDSYFVATEGPESSDIYDVFLIDSDFTIERPKRVYRTGFSLISGKATRHDPKQTTRINQRPGLEAVDPDNPLDMDLVASSGEDQTRALDIANEEGENEASHHTFFISNSQRKLKLIAKNARVMHQFIVSMERIAAQSVWASRNRFDSFAPLRLNVAAQWLVDGRDYFWNLSRALNMAKNTIYIHDWWVSPELYLRRPGDERYRLDHLLRRKAEEGVKIFVIIYNEVSDKTTPVDSIYTKKTLSNLHPDILVQRSPSHFQTGTFYWSHHEKLCVIDDTIAYMGGLDLCYGRWDTSQHVLTDEDYTEPDGAKGPIWRGKDYANERVMEYAELNKPFEDMFDRSRVPRMPWHDVGLQLVGQPARDLCRHFIQRWNLLIRTKNHKRRMPFLLPPPEFTQRELSELKLRGTCEVQICRSVGPWSMSTLTKVEHSIQNAYCKSIEASEHFIYIENQFFITSTTVDGIKIQNGIGDALVERIIRAHRQAVKWRACIVIPLLPGYTFPIDSDKASSVRLIVECQNRTICRGTQSIFSRLRKEGIDPDEYITFFSLRGWGKFKNGALTTEQVYIHGKTMIVDDRLVICGSANINERSQRGDRDSELVAVIRDTDMVDGVMGGRPFKVGRFAHTLRMRLMREHVGIDVDAIEEDQLLARQPVAEDEDEIEVWDPDDEQQDGDVSRGITQVKKRTARDRLVRTVESGFSSLTKGVSENVISNVSKGFGRMTHPAVAVLGGDTIAGPHMAAVGERSDTRCDGERPGFASSAVKTLEEKAILERRPSPAHGNAQSSCSIPKIDGASTRIEEENVASHGSVGRPVRHGEEAVTRTPTAHSHDDDAHERLEVMAADTPFSRSADRAADTAQTTLRKNLVADAGVWSSRMTMRTPEILPERFNDPLDDKFWKDMWIAVAVHNTEIYRKVFRCIPDDLVTTWEAYKAFVSHAEKFNHRPEDATGVSQVESTKAAQQGFGTNGLGGAGSAGAHTDRPNRGDNAMGSESTDPIQRASGDDVWTDREIEEMENLLYETRGHLVLYSTRFLEAEDLANNFLFNSDKILPLPIYD